jgi:hypothetical protein
MEGILNSLGREPEDSMVQSTKVQVVKNFFYWRTPRWMLSYHQSIDQYRECWRKNVEDAWPAILKALGKDELDYPAALLQGSSI